MKQIKVYVYCFNGLYARALLYIPANFLKDTLSTFGIKKLKNLKQWKLMLSMAGDVQQLNLKSKLLRN
jgi:hypothetical protein